MLSRWPCCLMFFTDLPNGPGRASTTMWPTIWRSRVRAAGTTTEGSAPESTVPAWICARSATGMDCGVSFAMSCSAFAAAFVSSVRITRSTKPTVNSSPFGSWSTAARRSSAGFFCLLLR